MSKFRYVSSKLDTVTRELELRDFLAISRDRNVVENCLNARKAIEAGQKDEYARYKERLPMAFWLGYNAEGKRAATKQEPTQYFLIDIDHQKVTTGTVYEHICRKLAGQDKTTDALQSTGIRLIHETPSGGTRIVVLATQDFTTVVEHMRWFVDKFELSQFGDIDYVVKDFARGSFMVMFDWIIYLDQTIFSETPAKTPILPLKLTKKSTGEANIELPEITDEMRNIRHNGVLVSKIAQEYIDSIGGVPEEGKRHAFYNELIKNFRNLCESDPKIVFAVLPLCEGTPERRWSQCQSICKSNNTTLLPKEFYYWMKKQGYVTSKKEEPLKELLASEPTSYPAPPTLPPIFREYCSICPTDFVYPTVIALMPIMGTMTSYLRADYMDYSEQSTTFFSCIYAPPGSNKSFTKKLVDSLMRQIKIRDEVNNLREQLWLIDERTRPTDEKGKDLPHVMVRIMPAINSLPEFLEKMRDNKGYHMFTFAEEVDTFKKGSSSGGSDKSDLFRTAWDNSEYGQSFKSAATFKGMVKVYYNILLTGTPGAVKKYYSNVEDGMVTRVSICEIQNQKFAKFQPWKQLNRKQQGVIESFVERCDENTYREPIDMEHDEALNYTDSSKNYDANVKWKFTLKPKQNIDMSWLFPTLLDWLEKVRLNASMNNDEAMDVFRRRTAVKGFRLALVCMACWNMVKEREKKIIKDFVLWFMDIDLEESLKMFGKKYNDLQKSIDAEPIHHIGLYDSLEETFTRNDVIAQCLRQGVHSRVKQIIWRWKTDKVIVKINDNEYKKVRKK